MHQTLWGGEPQPADRSSIETVFAAVPFLAKIADDGDGDEMDRVLVQRTIDMLNKVSEARNIRETAMHNAGHWITCDRRYRVLGCWAAGLAG
eukprot:COSAG01_NODE_21270_length_910_cov_1.574599_1_plen_91_part_10